MCTDHSDQWSASRSSNEDRSGTCLFYFRGFGEDRMNSERKNTSNPVNSSKKLRRLFQVRHLPFTMRRSNAKHQMSNSSCSHKPKPPIHPAHKGKFTKGRLATQRRPVRALRTPQFRPGWYGFLHQSARRWFLTSSSQVSKRMH